MLKLLKFSGKNLLGKKVSTLLLILFLAFWYSLVLFLEIWKSYLLEITDIVYSWKISENKLIIEKESSTFWSLFGKISKIKPWFNDAEIDAIKKISWVENIYKSSTFSSPAIMSIDMLWTSFTTDVFFEWIEESMLNEQIVNFDSNSDYIPLLVSEKIIDSLIKIFIKNDNVKAVTKELILSKEFDITFWKSTLTKDSRIKIKRKWKIVAFGEGSNFMFISIPLKSVQQIDNLLWKNDSSIDKLFLEVEKYADADILQMKIEDLGFSVINPEIEKEKMKNLISIFYKIWLSIITIIITLISYSLVSFIILRIVESKKDNSIMFELWVDRWTISKIYITESFIITSVWLIISLPLIAAFINIINNSVSNYNNIHNFIQLPLVYLDSSSFFSLIIFFVIINIVSISFSYFKVWRGE